VQNIPLKLFVSLALILAVTPLHAAVRVAILQSEPQQTADLTALVETRLSTAGKVSLVERQQIDKLLHEQQLQSVLGADAVQGRAKIGKLLQADLLVFIQRQDDPAPIISVVISETHHGLRLLRQAVDPAEGEKAADSICKFIDDAIAKQNRNTDEIFAVPPFIDDGLGFDYSYLKGAYSRLIEGIVAAQNGVLTADLSEARAIANEISLSSAGGVSRSLPLYILGSFRNDAAGADRRVRVTLKLMRGDKLISSFSKENLAPADVPNVLREATATFLSTGKTAAPAPLDPHLEAAQLAARARTMKDLGSLRDSLDLIEASLLLNPAQPQLNLDAVEMLTKYTEDTRQLAAEPALERPIGAARAGAYLDGLRNLEPYMRAVKLDRNQKHQAEVISRFATSMDHWGYDLLRERFLQGGVSKEAGKLQPATLDLLQAKYLDGHVGPFWDDFLAARKASSVVFYQVLHDKSRRRVVDDTLWFSNSFDGWGCLLYLPEGAKWYGGIDSAKRRALHLDLLAEFAYLPNEGDFLPQLVDYPGMHDTNPHDAPYRPGFEEFLHKARDVNNDSLRQKIDQLLSPGSRASNSTILIHGNAGQPIRQPIRQPANAATRPGADPSTGKTDPNDDVRFTPISLKLEGGRSPLPILGWLPAGKGIDFAWNGDGPLVMKEPGVLRHFKGLRGRSEIAPKNRLQVQFDGQYVWAIYDGIRRMKLLVLDPKEETVVSVDAAEGLPPCDEMSLAPLGPGRAAVLGYFGQSFAATIDIRAGAKPKATILHEFRHLPRAGDPDQWRDADTIFRPLQLFALSEPAPRGMPKRSLLAWRSSDEQSLPQHPITIDVAGGESRAIDEKFFFHDSERFCTHDGVVDQLDSQRGKNEDAVHRFGLSGMETRSMGLRTGQVTSFFYFGGGLHCIASHWLIADAKAGSFRQLKATFPRGDHGPTVLLSEHYGLVGFVNQMAANRREPDINLYRIEFAKPMSEYLKSP
jgi:hypothetical protein